MCACNPQCARKACWRVTGSLYSQGALASPCRWYMFVGPKCLPTAVKRHEPLGAGRSGMLPSCRASAWLARNQALLEPKGGDSFHTSDLFQGCILPMQGPGGPEQDEWEHCSSNIFPALVCFTGASCPCRGLESLSRRSGDTAAAVILGPQYAGGGSSHAKAFGSPTRMQPEPSPLPSHEWWEGGSSIRQLAVAGPDRSTVVSILSRHHCPHTSGGNLGLGACACSCWCCRPWQQCPDPRAGPCHSMGSARHSLAWPMRGCCAGVVNCGLLSTHCSCLRP